MRDAIALRALVDQRPALLEEGFALAAPGSNSKGPPARIQVAREGSWVGHPAGRFELTRDAFESMAANQVASGVMPCVDREHETWFGGGFEEPAGARGWAKRLLVDDDPRHKGKTALFAEVDWTEEGAEDVVKRRFLYVSGGFLLKAKSRATGEPIGSVLDHIAICKRPFIDQMEPLMNSLTTGAGRHHGGNLMNAVNKALALALGLAENTPEEQILAELEKRKNGLAAAGPPGPAGDPKTEARIAELEKRALAAEESTRVGLVDKAITEFRIKPAEKEFYLGLGKREGAAELEKALALREPAQPGAPGFQAGGGAPAATALQAGLAEVEAFCAAHPKASPADAVRALAASKPGTLAPFSIPGVC